MIILLLALHRLSPRGSVWQNVWAGVHRSLCCEGRPSLGPFGWVPFMAACHVPGIVGALHIFSLDLYYNTSM